MSWERKLLHCGPRADLRDLLAHYLFISVLHHWLPRGSDHAWSLTAQAACGGQSPGHGSQMDSCMLLERQFSSLQIFVFVGRLCEASELFFVVFILSSDMEKKQRLTLYLSIYFAWLSELHEMTIPDTQ